MDYPDESNPVKGFWNRFHKWMCFTCPDTECTLDSREKPEYCPCGFDRKDHLYPGQSLGGSKLKCKWVIPRYKYSEVGGGVVVNPDYEEYYGVKPPKWRKENET